MILSSDPPQVLPGPSPASAPCISLKLEDAYLVVCWDDPVNLMDYVTHVFQKVFGWSQERAHRHMLEVHEQGKAFSCARALKRRSITCTSSSATICSHLGKGRMKARRLDDGGMSVILDQREWRIFSALLAQYASGPG